MKQQNHNRTNIYVCGGGGRGDVRDVGGVVKIVCKSPQEEEEESQGGGVGGRREAHL